jgi:hypothetical protein
MGRKGPQGPKKQSEAASLPVTIAERALGDL